MKFSLKILVGAATAMALSVYSCKDSFLDTPPQAALSNSLLASNRSGVDATLISAYKSLGGWTGAGANAWGAAPTNWVYNLAADDFHKGSEPGDGDGWLAVELFQWSPSEGSFSDKWRSCYEGIVRANSAINTSNEYLESHPEDAEYVSQVQGEAIFLRGWQHFELYKVFKNVPYFNEEDTEFNKPNDQDIMPLIIADFEKAAQMAAPNKTAVGRVDRTIATAYAGKAKLYSGDFAGALADFNTVINSGKYELSDCIYDNFNLATENNSENMLSFQASVNDGDAGGANANNHDRLGLPHGASFTSCCGFKQPTFDLVMAFKVDDNGLPVSTKGVPVKEIEAGDPDPLDPRVDYAAGRTGVPYLDWDIHSDGWIRGQGYQGWYSPKKTVHLKANPTLAGGWTGTQLSALNMPLMRYSDVLLMAAECEVEIGSLEKAREYVNMIRERAGNCAQGKVGDLMVPIDSPDITWANYNVGTYDSPWTDKDAARSAVRTERRLELALEGHRVFDLRRWGNYAAHMAEYVAREKVLVPALNNAQPVTARHDAFPIPAIEISKSNGTLTQNPGY